MKEQKYLAVYFRHPPTISCNFSKRKFGTIKEPKPSKEVAIPVVILFQLYPDSFLCNKLFSLQSGVLSVYKDISTPIITG